MPAVLLLVLLAVVSALAQSPDTFAFVHSVSGNGDDEILALAVGRDGSVFVVGTTTSTDFVATARLAEPAPFNNRVLFVRRISPAGTLLYSSVIGPARQGDAPGLGVDGAGNAYVAHVLTQLDGPPATALEDRGNVLLTKVAPDGSRVVSRVSLVPNVSIVDTPIGLVVEESGRAYVAAGNELRRVSADGTRIEARTRIDCGNNDSAIAIRQLARGGDGSVYASGFSRCQSFPATSNAWRSPSPLNVSGAGFVVRFPAELGPPLYATLVGDYSLGSAMMMAVSPDGSAIVGGSGAVSEDLPPAAAASPLRANFASIGALSADGTVLTAATWIPMPKLLGLATDANGNVLAVGSDSNTAVFLKLAPGLTETLLLFDPPARDVRKAAITADADGFSFALTSGTRLFPQARQSSYHGFAGRVREAAATTALEVATEILPAVPEQPLSSTACRVRVTNHGPADAAGLALFAKSSSGGFQYWTADRPFVTAVADPALATAGRLPAGDSVTIDFLSVGLVSASGVSCSALVTSGVLDSGAYPREAKSTAVSDWVNVSVSVPSGLSVRRDDWPLVTSFGILNFAASRNSKMRLYIPSPAKDNNGRIVQFSQWTDGSRDNPRILSIGSENVRVSATFVVAPEGTAATTDLDGGAPSPEFETRDTAIFTLPHFLPTGSEKRVVTIRGSGLRRGWEARWNGQKRETVFAGSTQLEVTLTEEDLAQSSLNWITIHDASSGQQVRGPHAFWVPLNVRSEATVYDAARKRTWIATAGPPTGNAIVAVERDRLVAGQVMALPAAPQRLALSSDGRFLYVAAEGRVYRLDTESMQIESSFALPAEAASGVSAMTGVPGRPNQVIVATRSGPIILFTDGVAATPALRAVEGVEVFYGWADERTVVGAGSRTLIAVTVDNGLRVARQTEWLGTGSCVPHNRLLYCASGDVYDMLTAALVRQYPTAGTVGVSPERDLLVSFGPGAQPFPGAANYGPMVISRLSSGEFVSSTLVPLVGFSAIEMAGGDTLLANYGYPFFFQLP